MNLSKAMDFTEELGGLDVDLSSSHVGTGRDPKDFTRWGGWLSDILAIQKPGDTPDGIYLETLLRKLEVLNRVGDLKGIVSGVLAFTQSDLDYLCSNLLDGLWKGVTNLDKGQDSKTVRFKAGRPTSVPVLLKRCIHFPAVFAFLKEQNIPVMNKKTEASYSEWVNKAVAAGALGTLEWLWDQGGTLTDEGTLNNAALCGYLPIFKFLHSKGVDLPLNSEAPLMWACDFNQLETARFLLEIADKKSAAGEEKVDETVQQTRGYCFPRAIANDRLELVKLLLAHGVNPNLPNGSVQRAVIASSKVVYLDLFLEYGLTFDSRHFETAIEQASIIGELEMVERLIKLGFSVNDNNGSLLNRALRNGNLSQVKIIFTHGGNAILTNVQQNLLARATPEIQEYLEGVIMARRSMGH